MKIILLLIMTFFAATINSRLIAEEVTLDQIDATLESLAKGPNPPAPCNKGALGQVDEKEYKGHFFLSTRNDVLAFPISTIRNKRIYLIDMGETHGLELEAGFPIRPRHQLTINYDTRLYTDTDEDATSSALYDYVSERLRGATSRDEYEQIIRSFQAGELGYTPDYRYQTFTTETTLSLAYGNTESKDPVKYSLGLGLLDYDSSNDENLIFAAAQQRVLHNNINSLNDLENSTSTSTIEGTHLIATGHLEKSYSPTKSILITPYTDLQLSSSLLSSTFTAGVKASAHFDLSIDLPATIFWDKSTSLPMAFIKPTLRSSIRYKDTEFGYSLEQPYGVFHRNIPQNKTREFVSREGWTAKDLGEMGSLYFRYTFK